MVDWYAAQAKPGSPDLAIRNLSRQGFVPFLPWIEAAQRTPQGQRRVRKALFPGYLFVSNVGPGDFRRLGNTPGLRRILGLGAGGARPVPPDFIAALIGDCDETGLYRRRQHLAPGDRVALVCGPLTGVEVEIESLPDAGRVAVLLEVMGRPVRTSVGLDQLDPGSRRPLRGRHGQASPPAVLPD